MRSIATTMLAPAARASARPRMGTVPACPCMQRVSRGLCRKYHHLSSLRLLGKQQISQGLCRTHHHLSERATPGHAASFTRFPKGIQSEGIGHLPECSTQSDSDLSESLTRGHSASKWKKAQAVLSTIVCCSPDQGGFQPRPTRARIQPTSRSALRQQHLW